MIGPIDLVTLARQTGLPVDDLVSPPAPDRRGFLKLAVGTSAGLLIGVTWSDDALAQAAKAGVAKTGAPKTPLRFSPFVEITPDNRVIVIVKHLDKGQGAATGLATLVAEELDADWKQIDVRFAPADAKTYGNIDWGGTAQGVGGSTGLSNSWKQYREAGAAAKQMLLATAAERWKLPPERIRVGGGRIIGGNRNVSYGEMAPYAAKAAVPAKVTLKQPSEWRYIGRSVPRVDRVAKTTGAPVFTQDVKLPGMLTAVIARSPKFGGAVGSVDATAAKAVKGIVDVVQIPQGVAVLAQSTWAAMKGREALKITWNDEKAEKRSSAQLLTEYKALANTPGLVARKDGDADAAIKGAAKTIEAEFVFPFLAHAPMEPMNCVMHLVDGKATVWTGSQLQTVDHAVTAGVLGLKPENVDIKTLWAGGSFGRRAVYNSDFVAETAALVKAYGKPVPIKVVWSREDDVRGGYYRPMYVHKVRVGLKADGSIAGWHHRIVGQSILAGTPFEAMLVKNGIDATSVEGVADTPYAIPNLQVEVHNTKVGVPPLWWRSVGHTHTAYVMETLIDEIARAAGKDPVAYRLSLLEKHPKHVATLKLAAEKAGWATPPPAGTARGIAVHESFKSVVAEVAEVTMVRGRPKVTRVVAAIDCGIAVNPDIVKAQIEGGIGYGLGAVLHSKLTLKDGVVEQGNFGDYEVLRYEDMPAVEVHIVPSANAPMGVGEPGTPPIGPAVANAVAKLTGQQVRTLPMADVRFTPRA